MFWRYLQVYAPSNVLIRSVRSARPRWQTALALVALATILLVATHAVALAVERSAPGWLNLIVLVLVWDAIKVACLAVGVVLRSLAMAGAPFIRRNAQTTGMVRRRGDLKR